MQIENKDLRRRMYFRESFDVCGGCRGKKCSALQSLQPPQRKEVAKLERY